MIQCILLSCIRKYNQEPGNDRQSKKKIHKEKSKSIFIEKTLKDFPNIRKSWLEKSYEK